MHGPTAKERALWVSDLGSNRLYQIAQPDKAGILVLMPTPLDEFL
jgi:hypothetical protein